MTLDELIEELLYFRGQSDGKMAVKIVKSSITECDLHHIQDFEPTMVRSNGELKLVI